MKSYILSLLKHWLFWFLLFFVGRVVFIIFNVIFIPDIGWAEIFATFFHALFLDCSTACYLTIVPLLLLSLELFISSQWIHPILQVYHYILLLALVMLYSADALLYQEWSVKINYKALQTLLHAREIFKTATYGQTIIFCTETILLTTFFVWFYRKFILKPHIKTVKRGYFIALACSIMGVSLLFIGMRGGILNQPIAQSVSYFSKRWILNDAAVNTPWNTIHSIIESRKLINTSSFYQMPDTLAQNIVQQLYHVEQDTSPSILKRQPVNIVFILLESWSADLVASLGGRPEIAPHFAQLEKEGLLFSQIYANGHRSQQGISALLSGFPPVPVINITDHFGKYSGLNSLVRDLKTAGYSSAFYYGGDLIFGNIKAYLMSQQFDKIIDEHDLPSKYPRGRLSIHDQYTMEYQLEDTKNLKQPFFSMVFTASSHNPYDQPKMSEPLTWDVAELPYLNAVRYSDSVLGDYFEKARHETWYPNTLFILIADHSHPTYKQWYYHSAEHQHIPMLWLGEPLKDEYKGKQWDKMAAQTDVAYTLLKQLNIPAQHYIWSLDILGNHADRFVPVETNVGFNWITPAGFIAHNAAQNAPMVNTYESDSLFQRDYIRCKAYLQYLYQEYLKK